jgi:hypothetical protein
MCVAELVIRTIAGAAIALALLEEAGVLDLHHIERAFWVVSPGMVPSVPFVLYFHADVILVHLLAAWFVFFVSVVETIACTIAG